MLYKHTPVMLREVMEILNPQPGQYYIDCTLGGGGYTKEILDKTGSDGKVLAVDLDDLAIENAKLNLKSQIKNHKLYLAHDNFKNLQAIVEKHFTKESRFDGIVFDLGLSSAQLEDRNRGFAFSLALAPLGMNFGSSVEQTAENIINYWSLEDLVKIFKDYGEEKFARPIASAIVSVRQSGRISTTGQLVKIIAEAIPEKFKHKKIHPATKIFQALRLAVNQELENLRQALPPAVNLLKPGGKLIVISYHSLEDRIVKQFFKKESRNCLCPPLMPVCQCGHQARLKIVIRGVLRPTEEEVLINPRSRSAK